MRINNLQSTFSLLIKKIIIFIQKKKNNHYPLCIELQK
jgi:hypothetical protein